MPSLRHVFCQTCFFSDMLFLRQKFSPSHHIMGKMSLLRHITSQTYYLSDTLYEIQHVNFCIMYKINYMSQLRKLEKCFYLDMPPLRQNLKISVTFQTCYLSDTLSEIQHVNFSIMIKINNMSQLRICEKCFYLDMPPLRQNLEISIISQTCYLSDTISERELIKLLF